MSAPGEAMSPTLLPRKRPPLSRSPSRKSEGESGSRKSVSPPKGVANMIRKPSVIDRLNDSGASYRNYLEKIDSKELSQEVSPPSSSELKKEDSNKKASELLGSLEPIESMGYMERGSSRSNSEFYASKTIVEEALEASHTSPLSKVGSFDKGAFIKNKTNSRLK